MLHFIWKKESYFGVLFDKLSSKFSSYLLIFASKLIFKAAIASSWSNYIIEDYIFEDVIKLFFTLFL